MSFLQSFTLISQQTQSKASTQVLSCPQGQRGSRHQHSHPWTLLNHQTCMPLDCGTKPEYLDGTWEQKSRGGNRTWGLLAVRKQCKPQLVWHRCFGSTGNLLRPYTTQTFRLLVQAFYDVWLSDISTSPVSHSSLMNLLVSGQKKPV